MEDFLQEWDIGTSVPAERQLRQPPNFDGLTLERHIGTSVPAERQLRPFIDESGEAPRLQIGTSVPAERQLRQRPIARPLAIGEASELLFPPKGNCDGFNSLLSPVVGA